MHRLGYNSILFLLAMAYMFFSLMGYAFAPSNGDVVLYILCVVSLVFDILSLLCLRKKHGTWFKMTIIFLAMFVIYMHGQIILNVFGLTTGQLLSGKFNSGEIINGLFQVNLYFSMFLIAIASTKTYEMRNDNDIDSIEFYDPSLVKAGAIITVCSLPFELYVNLSKLYFALNYGYASLYQEVALNSISSGYKILSYFFLSGCFYLLFGSRRGSITEKIAWGLILMHAVMELLIGYRASAIVFLLH